MTGFTADLFHRGSLWGLSGRDCAIRWAFSSAIHSALVLPFQCWWARGSEITDAPPQCGAANQVILPPHCPMDTAGLFKTLARWKATRKADQEPASPVDESYVGAAWTWPDLVLPQWCWGKSNLGRQDWLLCLSSPSVPQSYMSQPDFAQVSLFLSWPDPVPRRLLAAQVCPWLVVPYHFWVGTKAASYAWSSQMHTGREGVWCPGDKNPFLCWPVPFCGTSLSPVWQWGGQGRPKYKPERLNSHLVLTNEISS